MKERTEMNIYSFIEWEGGEGTAYSEAKIFSGLPV